MPWLIPSVRRQRLVRPLAGGRGQVRDFTTRDAPVVGRSLIGHLHPSRMAASFTSPQRGGDISKFIRGHQSPQSQPATTLMRLRYSTGLRIGSTRRRCQCTYAAGQMTCRDSAELTQGRDGRNPTWPPGDRRRSVSSRVCPVDEAALGAAGVRRDAVAGVLLTGVRSCLRFACAAASKLGNTTCVNVPFRSITTRWPCSSSRANHQ